MKNVFSFHPKLVVRTPRYPFRSKIKISQQELEECIYLASPVLAAEMKKSELNGSTDEKIRLSVQKYQSRMQTRCTPFGLFSGCHVTEWNESSEGIVISSKRIGRHTRFDMHYLCALAQGLSALSCIKPYLRYFRNNSIYSMGDELRYVDYKYVSGKRKHQISSVFSSAYLNAVLTAATNGIRFKEIVDILVREAEVSQEEALEFADELLNTQLLVNELEPAISGDEFIYQMLNTLTKIQQEFPSNQLETIIGTLQKADQLLKELDNCQVNSSDKYRAIQVVLQQLGVQFEESKLFQTDMIRVGLGGGLPVEWQSDILGALQALSLLIRPRVNTKLENFKSRFIERYEGREIGLLEVLDTESGIGYPDQSGNDTVPLVEDLYIPPGREREGQVPWGRFESMMHKKLINANKSNLTCIEITDEDLEDFKKDASLPLPPSLSVMFRPIGQEQAKIYIEAVIGSSAANLLGRFAHADAEIHQLVNDITSREQELNPNIIFAEVIHLPESRVGNVLLHPRFRPYEIPYLAKASVENEYRVDVNDLYVSVINNEVVLRSKKLNKRIIPRLSTAHNYRLSALPVYYFLCDLQCQNLNPGLMFQWAGLTEQFNFLPRINYKRVVLSPATWNIYKKDFQALLTAKGKELQERIDRFRAEWQLPQQVVLAEGDNELLIDFNQADSVAAFVDAIKNHRGIQLKEFLTPGELVKDEDNNVYCNQVVATLIKNETVYKSPLHGSRTGANVVRNFSPGSEWLYYKFYCGVKSADKILAEAIRPLTELLQEKQLIKKFFFIRYNDPSFHIRLRFQLHLPAQLGEVASLVQQYISGCEEQGFIWKIQLDTYSRELERYGYEFIESAESLFYYDSIAVLNMLCLTEGDEREQLRWLWAIRAIDEMLDNFRLLPDQKLEFMNILKNGFLQEFNAGKTLKTQLNNKYRENRKIIESCLDRKCDEASGMNALWQVLRKKSESIQPLADQWLSSKDKPVFPSTKELLSSLVHMLVNRIVLTKPRQHELVIYDMLYQYYFSLKAREKFSKSNKRAEKISEQIA